MASRMRPGTQVAEKELLRRGGSLGQKYAPQKTAQIGGTRGRLKRYGGYQVNDDGSVNEQRAANGQAGQAYREAYQEGTSAANSRGMLESSFAAKTVGAAWGRLSQEAQDIVTQHAVTFNQILMAEGAEFDEINVGLMQLYGDEAQWMLDNPPPLPDPPAAASSGAGSATAKDGANIVWKGSGYPNLQSLQARHPGQQLGVRRAGDGSYVVVLGSGGASPPGATPPRTSQVINGGRPTGRTGRGSGNVRFF
jgi:hypothetical protein